jgi:hypothetical protein
MSKFISLISVLLLLSACQPKAEQNISFYYWKSIFSLNETELSCLKKNKCAKIYLKYFDVVKEGEQIKPIATLTFNNSIPQQSIVPVIFIKNDALKNIQPQEIEKLAKHVLSMVDQINFSNSITVSELQLDCDWTEKTKENYFAFLKKIKQIFRDTISSTIRLHQIKYKDITGIPPVDKGVLMYYNMNDITPGSKNSIYDKNTANKYLNTLRSYPLPLDIALPIFTWGIQSRDNKVVGLLNKINENELIVDSCFLFNGPFNFTAKHACFKSGYYFQQGDKIKIEYVKEEELLQIADDIKTNLSSWPPEIIFYDLDSLNLTRYDQSIFQKVLDRFK